MSKQILRESLAVRRLLEVNPSDLKDDVIAINRVTKVVKGGKNLSFSALVVVGDNHGHAGFGMGKAREVPMTIKKGVEQAKKKLPSVRATHDSAKKNGRNKFRQCED